MTSVYAACQREDVLELIADGRPGQERQTEEQNDRGNILIGASSAALMDATDGSPWVLSQDHRNTELLAEM
ncbi:hypothetical protein NHX12_007185 [Muraenolepis orangiensis]|uniref:Uncharacterized protein n=1 Tax=Muraenolepis orangiensis TaxID=630683 RepID=A0A9Q0DRU8_9TELE|nr:hypothetical protein NHX12_007185 [Muraenolepis orangiensis]